MSLRTVLCVSVIGIASILVACTPLDDELYGSRAQAINWDGGTKVIINGSHATCIPGGQWGCCDGDTVIFCKGGKVYQASCASKPKCGWSASQNHYACGTNGAKDPGGKPKSCMPVSDGGPPPLPDGMGGPSCGKVTSQGCCDGFILHRCDNKVSIIQDCSSKSLQCGWDSIKSRYACGPTPGKDPSGKYPISCKGMLPDGGTGPGSDAGPPPPVGDGGGGPGPQKCGKLPPEGCCGGNMLDYCQNGSKKTLDCTSNPKCGWDATKKKYACGTSGAQDPGGKFPISCKGYMTGGDGGGVKPPDGTIMNEGGGPPQGCQGLPPQGCCGGNMLDYCQNNSKMSKDCSGNPKCGWDATKKKYACGTAGSKDPSGKYPISCKSYMPDGGGTGPGDGGPPPGEGGPPPIKDGGGGPPKKGCGKLPPQGCCQGDMLDYCQNKAKMSKDCKGNPKCGWSATQKIYTCGTSGGSDPSGKFPMSCKKYLDVPDGGYPDGPATPPTDGPVKPPTDGPVKPPTDGPVKPPTDGPVIPPPDGPVKPPTDGPVIPPTDGPVKPPTDGPVKPPTDGTVKPPTDGTVKPPTDGTIKDKPKTNPEAGKPPGSEGGPCYGNGTCDAGLKCFSKVCVKVPAMEAGPTKTDTGGGGGTEDDTGCECATSSPSSTPVFGLLLLGLALLRLRRRKI